MPIVPLRFPCPTHWLVNICPGYDHCFLTSRRVSNYTEEGTPIFWSTGSNETNQRGHSGIDESDTMTRVDWCLRPTTAGKEHSFALSSDRTLLDYTGKYFGLQPAGAGKEHSFALSSDRTVLYYTGKYFGVQNQGYEKYKIEGTEKIRGVVTGELFTLAAEDCETSGSVCKVWKLKNDLSKPLLLDFSGLGNPSDIRVMDMWSEYGVLLLEMPTEDKHNASP